MGTALEASVLITGNLVDIGTPQIWAKAISAEHGRILQRIGAHHVVFPEADAGNRVAHLVSGKLLDYIEVEDGFTIVKMRPPKEAQGFTIDQSRILEKYGVTVIGVKSPGQEFVYATGDTRIAANDLIVVSGHSEPRALRCTPVTPTSQEQHDRPLTMVRGLSLVISQPVSGSRCANRLETCSASAGSRATLVVHVEGHCEKQDEPLDHLLHGLVHTKD